MTESTNIKFLTHSYRGGEGEEQVLERHRELRPYQAEAHRDVREEPSPHQGRHRAGENSLNILIK